MIKERIKRFLFGECNTLEEVLEDGIDRGFRRGNELRVKMNMKPIPRGGEMMPDPQQKKSKKQKQKPDMQQQAKVEQQEKK